MLPHLGAQDGAGGGDVGQFQGEADQIVAAGAACARADANGGRQTFKGSSKTFWVRFYADELGPAIFSSIELQSRTTQRGLKKKLRETDALFPAVGCNLGIDRNPQRCDGFAGFFIAADSTAPIYSSGSADAFSFSGRFTVTFSLSLGLRLPWMVTI